MTDDVGEGFRSQITELVERGLVGGEEMDTLRGRARQDARADRQSRELGRFRAWCRGEAQRAAERLAREAREAPAVGEQPLAGVAVGLVLPDRVLDGLAGERVLELGGEDGVPFRNSTMSRLFSFLALYRT